MNEDTPSLMVTIRCITYNHEPFIRQCLEGFVMQKTDFRFEAVVHDDASTDGTAAIIKEYAEKYPDIIKPIYETENQYSKHDGSLGRIMDDNTHGKYVALCEGDDYWTDPFKLQKQIDFMEANPGYSMYFHNAVIEYYDKIKCPRLFNQLSLSRELSLSEIVNKWMIPTASIIVRTNVIHTIPEWKNKIYSGDMTLALWACHKGKVWGSKSVMSVYRVRMLEGSASAVYGKKPDYVYSQLSLLYSLFDTETGFIYHHLLKDKVNQFDKLSKYYKTRKKSCFLSFLLFPKIYINLVINRIKAYLRF